MKKLLSLFIMSLICEYNIYAQQGYWFQNHFIVLEPDNSSQYYVQLVGEDIPKGDNTSVQIMLKECKDFAFYRYICKQFKT